MSEGLIRRYPPEFISELRPGLRGAMRLSGGLVVLAFFAIAFVDPFLISGDITSASSPR